jgi:hypothetical protein
MQLKNVVAVCLISLFSATLVLLIARALDLNTAARMENELARIADELEAIRRSGGIAAAAGAAPLESLDDTLVVYYFHGTTRCPMCLAIESQTLDTLRSDFADQLDRGGLTWKVLNYEEPAAAELAREFEIQQVAVVVARINDGQIDDWNRLDSVLVLWDDEAAFSDYIRDEIRQMLPPDAAQMPIPSDEPPEIPIPTADSPTRNGVF